MADLDITLKRYNGSTYDVLHPTTVISQVTGLQTALDAKIPLTQKGAANGVATLDASGLIPSSQLGAYIRGGVRIQGTMGGASYDTVGELVTVLESIVSNSSGAVTREELIGYAFIASQDFTLNQGTLPTNTAFTINPGDEGDSTVPIDIEVGDILMVSNYSFSSPTHTYTFAVINNTYGAATTAAPGIVTLSQSTTTQDSSSAVITEAVLGGLIGTGSGNIAAGDHNHDSTYLGISATAAAATKWATARNLSLTGDATATLSAVDGTANVSAALTLANSGVTAGTYKSVTVDAKGRVTSGSNPTTLSGYGITDAQPLDGDLTSIAGLSGTTGYLKKTAANTYTLDTSTFLTGNQTITLSGDATGSGSTAIALTLANSGVTAGTYKSVTVDAKGRVTAGTNPTTLAGFGITDAYTDTQVDTQISNAIANRPEIYYDTAPGTPSTGDYWFDID